MSLELKLKKGAVVLGTVARVIMPMDGWAAEEPTMDYGAKTELAQYAEDSGLKVYMSPDQIKKDYGIDVPEGKFSPYVAKETKVVEGRLAQVAYIDWHNNGVTSDDVVVLDLPGDGRYFTSLDASGKCYRSGYSSDTVGVGSADVNSMDNWIGYTLNNIVTSPDDGVAQRQIVIGPSDFQL